MLRKTITYVDFNDEKRTEDFYFNLTKTELAELDIDAGGNLVNMLTRMARNQDGVGMAKFLKEMIVRSYGEKTDDGRYFEKGDGFAKGKRFTQTAAFDVLFTEILTDPSGEAIQSFLYGIIPADIAAQAKANTTPNLIIGDEGTEAGK